jgi:hypothetical protein
VWNNWERKHGLLGAIKVRPISNLKKSPDAAAMKAMSIARSNLSSSRRKDFDNQFEILI